MKKKKERFIVKITTFVTVVFLIDIILFLKPFPNSNKTLSTPEIIFAICLFFLIITFFYLIVGFVLDFYEKTSLPSLKIKKHPAVKIFINRKEEEEIIPCENCVLKKDETIYFNDECQEVRREKLMITDKNTSRISQEELEEFFKRPMSHTTEYKIKDFAEALE